MCFVCGLERKRKMERELGGKVRGGASLWEEKEGWVMTLSAVYIATLVGAVWMALDYLLFKHTHTADAP